MPRYQFDPARAAALGSLGDEVLFWSKFGRNPDVDAATSAEDIHCHGGLYAGFPATNVQTITVTSDSDSDTSDGTGARTWRIVGLDGNGDLTYEDVILNGTGGVVTTQTFYRAFRSYGLTAGTGGVNAGNISLTHTTSGAYFAYAVAGFGHCQSAVFTVPADYYGVITRLHGECSNNGASAQEATLAVITKDVGSTGLERVRDPFIVSTGAPSNREITGGILVRELTDISLRAIGATSDNLIMVGSFDIFITKGKPGTYADLYT